MDFSPTQSSRRLPWFAAGVGIPLLCIALIAPFRGAPTTGVDSSDPNIAEHVAATAEPAPAGTLDEAAAQAATIAPAAGSIANAPANEALAATTTPAIEPGTALTMTVRRGDSLDRMFKRNSLDRRDLANIMALDVARKNLRLIKPGDEIQVRQDNGQVLRLDKPIKLGEILSIRRTTDGYIAETIEETLEAQPVRATGTIQSSLFLAAAEAGISDRTIMNLAGIFAWDVDFMLDIRSGDQFTLVYEEIWKNGERVAEGDILAAEFVNQGEAFRAIRFEDDGGRVDYYTPEGHSVRKAFVRAPLSFSRISSNFNPKRRHPKLNTIRAHKGVDYAAPTGTPIKAAGDGKIIHRGRKGGYGNTVILQHGGNITTLYAHMSKYGRGRVGSRVRQGQIIGYVGASGLATGPHLHYEYRRNGVHLNPRTVKLPDAEPIKAEYLTEFQKAAKPLLQQLESTRTLMAGSSKGAGGA
ncbi:MAG: peptidoglycan DD-metalloendopeptidase family protein [Gammaproteobacteria bacterium]